MSHSLGLRCFLLLLPATLFGEISEDVCNGLKQVLQDPLPNSGKLFEFPLDYLVGHIRLAMADDQPESV